MKKLLIGICLAAIAANAIESATVVIPRAVVVDDFEYMLVPPSVWQDLTNTVERLKNLSAQRWRKEHETVRGREMWHGAATNRIVNADGLSVTWMYSDGYCYTERESRTNAVRRVIQPKQPMAKPQRPAHHLPPRLEAKRQELESQPKAREVNAVFGPGGKLIRAEEVK